MDERAAATLAAAGYDASRHRARKFDDGWLDDYDLVLAMDRQNLADIGGRAARVAMFRDFDPVDTGADVPDPYYGGLGGFEEVLRMVERTGTAIVAALQQELASMTRLPVIAQRAEELLGASVVATAPVAGGDISTATRMRLSDGTTALVKTYPQAPEGFFDVEASGLRWLADADGVACPDVLGSDDECLILRWIEPGKTTVNAAVAFGQALARTHAAARRRTAWSRTASSAGCRCPTGPRRRGRSSTRPGGCSPTSSSPATGAWPPRRTRPRSSPSSDG